MLISRERFAEADELMKGLRLDPTDARRRGGVSFARGAHALRQRWAEAAERFATLVQVNQLDGWNIASMDFLGRGAALLAQGIPMPSTRLRQEAFTRFLPRRPIRSRPSGC